MSSEKNEKQNELKKKSYLFYIFGFHEITFFDNALLLKINISF